MDAVDVRNYERVGRPQTGARQGDVPTQITVGRLTPQRMSAILDQLRALDEQVYMDAWKGLLPGERRILKLRQDMRRHPTRGDVARQLGLWERQVRDLELEGLKRMFAAFKAVGKITVHFNPR